MVTARKAGRETAPEVLGRYVIHSELASGGMATVHLGRLLGPAGFARTVAIKRLHAHYAKDPDFVAMFLDEARLAARLRHHNIVPILDVVHSAGELFLVMEYVLGEALSGLLQIAHDQRLRIDPRISVSIIVGVLHGLHAAHEARDDRGVPLGLVHRDVSPQNILVGADGIARVLDFGIAFAEGRIQTTHEGEVKGKYAYMPPEMVKGERIDRRADVWSASVVLWELLTQKRLFLGDAPGTLLNSVLNRALEVPSAVSASPAALDGIVMRGLAREPNDRYATAREMAVALEETCPLATAREVGEWVEKLAGESLRKREHAASVAAGDGIQADASGGSDVRARLAALGVEVDESPEERQPVSPVEPGGTERVDVRGVGAFAMPESPPAASPLPKRKNRTRPARAALVVVTLVFAVAAAATIAMLRRGPSPVEVTRGSASTAISPPPATTAPPATVDTSTTAVVPVAPPAASPTVPPVAVTAPRPTNVRSPGSRTLRATETPSPEPSAPAPAPAPPSPAASASPSPSTRPGCDPPYRIVDGIRVVKRECM